MNISIDSDPSAAGGAEARALADQIAVYTAEVDWVTCGEILHRFGDGMRGKLAIEVVPHILTWAGISPLLIEAMKLLRTERPMRVVLWPISPLADLCDGSPLLRLPRARRVPKDGYKTDRWAHLGLRPVARLTPRQRCKAGLDADGNVSQSQQAAR